MPLSPSDYFARRLGRQPAKVGQFGVSPDKSHALDPAALKHYWHPDREAVEPCPSQVRTDLTLIHPDLRCVKPPAGAPMDHKPWIVWFRNPLVTHRLCPGWSLVLIWESPDSGDPLPLDPRLYANLYMRDPRRFKNGAEYFKGCMDQMQQAEARKKDANSRLTREMSNDVREFNKIKNIGHGSKYALHHDGTMVPSKGEHAWRASTLYDRLPAKVREDAERDGRNTKRTHTVSSASGELGAHREWNRDVHVQLELLKLMKHRREELKVRLSRKSVAV
jgi:hypothetical protein